MTACVVAASILVLVVMLWLAHRLQSSKAKHEPITLALARLLRRAGRWLWALGEAVEVGYHHSIKVRGLIGLDIPNSPDRAHGGAQ